MIDLAGKDYEILDMRSRALEANNDLYGLLVRLANAWGTAGQREVKSVLSGLRSGDLIEWGAGLFYYAEQFGWKAPADLVAQLKALPEDVNYQGDITELIDLAIAMEIDEDLPLMVNQPDVAA